MSPRSFLRFFKTKTGAFTLFALAGVVGYVLLRGFGSRIQREGGPDRKAIIGAGKKAQTVETVVREMTPFQPPKETPKAAQVPPEPVPPQGRRQAEVLPISLYASAEKESSEAPLGKEIAPFGRLVPCELVVTVDSSTIDTPIIGLVTADIWHQGRRIIPAGTEVHGRARVDRVRERIAADGHWTFVWQTGEELSLPGLALDREQDGDESTWGLTDGSAGLRGELLKTDNLAEVKLFAATFLSGAAAGLTDRESTAFGSQLAVSLKNAQLAGAQQALNGYAKQIYETIQREGFYVRVPAGKQFYVYVTQTIDKGRAVFGGSRIRSGSVSANPVAASFPERSGGLTSGVVRAFSEAPLLSEPNRARPVPLDPVSELPIKPVTSSP